MSLDSLDADSAGQMGFSLPPHGRFSPGTLPNLVCVYEQTSWLIVACVPLVGFGLDKLDCSVGNSSIGALVSERYAALNCRVCEKLHVKVCTVITWFRA
jgi:hypothetical protein